MINNLSKKEFNLENKQIILSTIKPHDVSDDYVSWLNDYEVTKYTEQRFYKNTKKNIKKFVADKFNSQSELLFGIFFKKKHVGNIKLGQINKHHLSADLSYILGEKKFWNQGIITKSIKLVKEFAFQRLLLKKITSSCYENNIGSIKVLKKNNFCLEGVLKKQIVFENERVNTLKFGISSENE